MSNKYNILNKSNNKQNLKHRKMINALAPILLLSVIGAISIVSIGLLIVGIIYVMSLISDAIQNKIHAYIFMKQWSKRHEKMQKSMQPYYNNPDTFNHHECIATIECTFYSGVD